MKKLLLAILLFISTSISAQTSSNVINDSIIHKAAVQTIDSMKARGYIIDEKKVKKEKRRKTWDVVSFGIFVVGTAAFFILK
jgi:hypothetical protein